MWFQLKIVNCLREEIEQVSDELEEHGALSVMLTDKNDNPVLEPELGTTPLWPEVVIEALFARAEDAQYARDQLIMTYNRLDCHLDVLPDKDWERAWMDDFKPQRFGATLWICPTWSTPPDANAVNLMLDPGLAFGTGTHPTTSLCLTWLEQAPLDNKLLIDYGCGSGILSLAAIKLGAKHVHAVDIDQQALQATQNNALVNQIGEEQLTISPPDKLELTHDLVIANILLAPLIDLKTRFSDLLHPKGTLVVSGLLSEQAPTLIEAYSSSFTLQTTRHLDGWSLLVFTRQ